MGDVSKQRFDGFLDEYRKLCLKYGLMIDGCGCCGSPYVMYTDLDDTLEGSVGDHIKHLLQNMKISVGEE